MQCAQVGSGRFQKLLGREAIVFAGQSVENPRRVAREPPLRTIGNVPAWDCVRLFQEQLLYPVPISRAELIDEFEAIQI